MRESGGDKTMYAINPHIEWGQAFYYADSNNQDFRFSDKAIKDPELIAEAKKAKIEMQFISPEQVLKDFTALMNQTPETLKEMGKYIKAES